MIPWHVASGMHGVVMVLPRDRLKDEKGKPLHFDKVFYIGENDLYVPKDENGKYKTYAMRLLPWQPRQQGRQPVARGAVGSLSEGPASGIRLQPSHQRHQRADAQHRPRHDAGRDRQAAAYYASQTPDIVKATD